MSNEQKKPKTIGDVVVNKVLGVNAKVETTKVLECGTVLFSINGGVSFAAVTTKEADVLVLGEVMLEGTAAELKTALFKQKIIVR